MNSLEKSYVKALIGRAVVYDLIGNIKDALEDINTALFFARENQNIEWEADSLLRLSDLYIDLSEYNEAQYAVKTALKIYKNLKDRKGEALLLAARVKGAKCLKIADREVDMLYRKAVRLFKLLRSPYKLAKTYYYYGTFLLSRGAKHYDQATYYLDKARKIFGDVGAKFWVNMVDRLETRKARER